MSYVSRDISLLKNGPTKSGSKSKGVLIIYQVSLSTIIKRRCNRSYYPIGHWGSEAIQQRQASVNKKDIDPANVQVRPMNEEDVDAIAVIDSMY